MYSKMTISCLLSGALLVMGCKPKTPKESMPDNVIRIETINPFVDNLKRLEPHLNMTTGFFKIKANDKMHVKLTTYLVENGKVQSLGSDGFKSQPSFEIGISVRQVNSFNDLPEFEIITSHQDTTGYSASKMRHKVDGIDNAGLFSTDIETSMKEVRLFQEFNLWGYFAGKTQGQRGLESSLIDLPIEEIAKRCTYGIVLRWEKYNYPQTL